MNAVVAMLALDGRDAAVLAAVRAVVARVPARVVLVHAAEGPPAEAEAWMRGLLPGAEVRVRAGDVAEVATDTLADVGADLLVVGRAPAEPGRPARGEHGRALLRAAGCPVLVVPDGAPVPDFRRAVVGMDLSPAALDALALAQRLADTVEAVAVLSPEDAQAPADTVGRAVRERLRAALAGRGLPEVPLRTVASGSPAEALLAAADGVDLLVVGSRGLSPLAAVFLGSTAERLAARSPRPVLVVRRTGEARGLLGALFHP